MHDVLLVLHIYDESFGLCLIKHKNRIKSVVKGQFLLDYVYFLEAHLFFSVSHSSRVH